MSRRDALFKFPASGVSAERKEDDLFDVRYFPEEYLSDVQEDTDNDSDKEDEIQETNIN